MQEKYLHYLWRMKRLDFRDMYLVNNPKTKVKVDEVGWYNQDAGPDFFNGSVWIDGIQWRGNIELHIKSSDWYAHNHHLDSAYNNVILHVVYEHDKEVIVDGRELPTIELKDIIDRNHLSRYERMILSDGYNQIPCYKNVKENEIQLWQQVNVSFLNRVERKGIELLNRVNERDLYEVFFKAIVSAVGGRVNAMPMQELSEILPYQTIIKESWNERRVEAMWFGCAGFLNRSDIEDDYYLELKQEWEVLKHKHKLQEMNVKSWKFGGVRPPSFPTLLLAQLSVFFIEFKPSMILDLDSEALLEKVKRIPSQKINPYWKTHYTFGKESKERNIKFTKQFINNIVVNGFTPMLVVLKHLYNNFDYMDKVIGIMEKTPSESNAIIDYWKSLDIFPKNALESQGLIELKNEFCNFKKCLSCKVGVGILE